MPTRIFTGFGGLKIVADIYGDENDPSVLLLPGGMQTRHVWKQAARLMAQAGRFVICPDLRGHGDSDIPGDGNYTLDSFIADLIAILAQLSSRPVIVGSTLGGWIALTALGEAEAPLATGLVLTNPPPEISSDNAKALTRTVEKRIDEQSDNNSFDKKILDGGFDFADLETRLQNAAKSVKFPTLIVRGTDGQTSSPQSTNALADLIVNCEVAEIEGGGHYVAFDNTDDFNAVLLEFIERHIPREPPEYMSGSDARTLRDAMGCFATGITVITTTDTNGKPVGLTVNSFSSVSLDPALVMVCLDKSANTLKAFRDADAFAVNILHIGQQPISNLFATKDADRFSNIDWEKWDQGVPIIANSLANFECMTRSAIEQGDHIIFVGEVVRAKFEQRRDPLLYYSGKYRRLHFN